MAQPSNVRLCVYRLWSTSMVQESVEVLLKTWLVDRFRTPHMCRESMRDEQRCMVPSLSKGALRRVPAWMCHYDPWCGAVVSVESSPPLVTRITVLLTALVASLMVVCAPRLLTYRPSNSLLVLLRRHTPWKVLVAAATGSIFQLVLDHGFLPFILPPKFLLTRIDSLITFVCATLLTTAVLVKFVQQPKRPLHTAPQIPLERIPTTDTTSYALLRDPDAAPTTLLRHN